MYLFVGKKGILRPKNGLIFKLMPQLAAFYLGPTPVCGYEERGSGFPAAISYAGIRSISVWKSAHVIGIVVNSKTPGFSAALLLYFSQATDNIQFQFKFISILVQSIYNSL
jgi:hypothetical protein